MCLGLFVPMLNDPTLSCFYHFLHLRFISSSSCFHAAVRMFFLAALFTDLPSLLFAVYNLQSARKQNSQTC